MPNQNKLNLIRQLIVSAEASIQSAKRIIFELAGAKEDLPLNLEIEKKLNNGDDDKEGTTVIEGVFNGQQMIGPDAKEYSIPANYASKSKLVEGDTLKLTIAKDGSFVYKQIGPVERTRLVGQLAQDEPTGDFYVLVNDHNYKVLLASVTYFKGELGDEAVILVPKTGETKWAAVENIIKKGEKTPNRTEKSEILNPKF